MACILLLPSEKHKGIISFTDNEVLDSIYFSNKLKSLIKKLKERWIICCHINHADFARSNYKTLDLIDIYFSGKDYFKNVTNVKNLELDCSNFISDDFCKSNYSLKSRFWDVLIISRNIHFKNLEDFFDIIRLVYNKKLVRVLAIIPEKYNNINPYKNILLKKYMQNFSENERFFFNLINPTSNFPWPFDMKTLEFFYKNSKVFLHTAHHERHPRNAIYAWVSGQIVVARKNVGINLSKTLNKKENNGFYKFNNINDASVQVLKALKNYKNYKNISSYRNVYLSSINKKKLVKKMSKIFNLRLVKKDYWFLERLDFRLANSFLPPNSNSLLKFLIALNEKIFLAPFLFGHTPEIDIINSEKVNNSIHIIYNEIINRIHYFIYSFLKRIYYYLPSFLKNFIIKSK